MIGPDRIGPEWPMSKRVLAGLAATAPLVVAVWVRFDSDRVVCTPGKVSVTNLAPSDPCACSSDCGREDR